MDVIKQIKIYPPLKGEAEIIIIYDVPDIDKLPDNGRYLGIDLGLHNLATCYNSATGETFITGRKYLSMCHYYNKEIARVQSQWAKTQSKSGIRYPKLSKHAIRLFKQKSNGINDYLHKITKGIVDYCKAQSINTVVIGDITGIRNDNDMGHVANQKLHSLPYAKLYAMLEYKLSLEGITFIRQKENYSSQTSPFSPAVNGKFAKKSNRVYRGLYKDGLYSWNADCVGAFNITRLYLQKQKIDIELNPMSIKAPYLLKVAV